MSFGSDFGPIVLSRENILVYTYDTSIQNSSNDSYWYRAGLLASHVLILFGIPSHSCEKRCLLREDFTFYMFTSLQTLDWYRAL